MKRTCNKCKALEVNTYGDLQCGLGYKIEKNSLDFTTISAKPQEDCPKPLTLTKYLDLMK